MSRWFRHYAGMMRDDKLVSAAIRSKQSIERVVWVWGAILESAAEIDDAGRYEVDFSEMAYFLRADEGDLRAIQDALCSLGRLGDGVVARWADRQFQSDRSRERQQRYRERHKQSGDGETSMGDARVTSLSRHRDAPETETETETETEKKKEPRASALVSDFPKDGFSKWYAIYPRHEAVEAARKSFERVAKSGKVTFAELIAGTDRYVMAMKGTERRFVRLPATWLNGGCWADEGATAPATSAPSQVPLGMVHVKRDSAEWDRYAERHRRERGKDPPTDSQGGWTFAVIEPERADCAA